MRIGIFAIILLLGATLASAPWVEPMDQKLLDAQFRFLREHALRPTGNDVVIVGIDDETTRLLREPLTLWHPHLGKFLQAVARSGAAAVGLDIVLPDRSFEAIVPGYDRQLLVGLLIARRTNPLVLALTVDPSGATRPIYPAFVAAAGQDATGYALLPVDDDGVVRRFDERIEVGGSAVPTLAGQMAARLGRSVGHGLIDYAAGAKFDYLPLHSVLEWYDAGDTRRLENALGGKVILLGGVFRFEDRLVAPVNLLAWDAQAVNAPGVVLHAQVLRNLLNGGLIAPAPGWVVPVLCLTMAMGWFVARSFGIAAVAVVAGTAAVLAASTWWLGHGRYLPPAAMVLTLVVAVGARTLYEASLQLRERRRLRRAFAAYVSPAIMREILRSDPSPGLGGARHHLCVLFADIRGFTERCERMPPEAAIGLLNRYFSEVTASVHGAGGTVDKFIGDGVMAFFGAPQRLDNPCVPAMRAARDMLLRLARLNVALAAQGEPPIAIGIGLHAGDAVVGNVGSHARHNYTAIGDTVNVASRLEGLTKEVDFPLVCSAAVFGMLEDHTGFVKLGARAIKGHLPVEVYGWRPDDGRAAVPKVETA
jgi:class 3 adenylate cyclase